MTSADVGGKISNRVKISAVRRKSAAKVSRKIASAGTAMVRYRKDPATRGLDYVQVCLSMPAQDLGLLDAACERTQMARSHFVRQAVRYFSVFTGASKL